MNNLDFNLKNYTFDFSDGQVKQFKSLISDLYKLLKDVYDRPRRQYQKYSSFIDYKVKRQRVYVRPDEFYRFVFDNITIQIVRRQHNIFSVAVSGVKPNEKIYRLLGNPDNYFSPSERDYSCGLVFYGHYLASHFNECVETFNKIVACIVFNYFGLDSKDLYKQLEFIF